MKKLLLSGLLVCVVALAQPASAAISITNSIFNGLQQWSDNSGDLLYNFAGGATTVDVGDVLLASFTVNTSEHLLVSQPTRNFGLASGVNEFSGLAAFEAVAKGGGPGGLLNPFTWVFAPVSAAKRALIATDAAFPLTGAELVTWAAGTMFAMYEDPSLDFDRLGAPGTEDILIGTAINGTRVLEAGFLGLAGEGWVASAVSDDVSVIGSIPAPANGGSFNGGVNIIPGTLTLPLNSNGVPSLFGGTVDFSLSGSLLGTGGSTTPFDAFDNVDFVVNFQLQDVPEPATMAIWGLGAVLGVMAFRRRRAQ